MFCDMLVMHSSFWLLLLALTTTADLYAEQDDSRYYLSRYGGDQDRCPRCDRGNGYDNLGYGLAPGSGRPSGGWGDGRAPATGSHAAGWGVLSMWKKDWDSRNSAGRDHGPSYYGSGSDGQWQDRDRLPRPAGGWDDRGASGGRWDDRGVSSGRWDDRGVSSGGRPGWSSWDSRGDKGGSGGSRWDDRRPSGGGRWDERYPTSGGRWEERYPTGGGRWDERYPTGAGRWDERYPTGASRWDDKASVGGGRWDERQPAGAGGGRWDERQPAGAGGGRWDDRQPAGAGGGRWDERQPTGAGGGRWDERGVVGGGGRWYERWDDRRPIGGGRWVEQGYLGGGRYDGRDPDRGYASGWDYGHAATRPPLSAGGTGSSSWHDHAGSGSGADRPCEPTRVHYKEYHYGGGGEETDRRPAKPWPTSYLSYLYDRNTSAVDLGSGEAPSTSPPDNATANPASTKT